ncbi:histidine--tRNA ligase [Candidatus Woesearchaeota archaeon CG_4_10_14_0_2_um_filter_33_10]|nr:MAG: histidine--tRNA ligase [Candidatus Woesearchaeota archaeon CG1_02_33_12]PIU72327.1 MAG: histidine--tRNA ligase [Candidatus Woesearchaeota archaeon CG06_land_8_20_14_3_00_33_13]PIZ53377.1 MAG: histidine--tRNA ligase [Candidatus Woesearchaeota archaeon CG_4_10_14_0_2_um_filter_33_10]
MPKEFKIAKGVKDWYGKDAILRNEIKDALKRVFERYGYNPIETPMIERAETVKFKGGEEIQKEIFTLKDQGKRELALRFDQTLPLARFVASNKDVKFPFKRYVIGEVFRDGPTQPEQGRYRVFTQCDVDILGVKDMIAEAELLALAQDCFKELELGNITVKINNRKLLDGILEYSGVPDKDKFNAIIILDKMDKIGIEGVKKEINSLLPKNTVDKLIPTITKAKNNNETYKKLTEIISSKNGKQGLNEIKQLLDYSKSMGLDFIEFDPSLARGLDYYTGTTIEVYLKDKSVVKSAVLAGGRFDNMIGAFMGIKKEIPAVGFSFGLERIAMILKDIKKNIKLSNTELYLIPINTAKECLKIACSLRNNGLNVDMDLKEKRMGQAITYADSLGIPYVGIIGEDELKENSITIKNLKTREQNKIKINEVCKYLKAK